MDLDDLEMEELAEEEGDERQNRTFVLLVAVMSGLLLIGIVAFCAWVLIVGKGYLGGGAAEAATTPEAVAPPGDFTPSATPVEAAAEEMTPTVEPTPTAVPTRVSPTPRPSPTPSPTSGATPAEAASAASTPTPAPTARARSTPVPTTAGETGTSTEMTETGIGAFTAVLVAAGLLILLVAARRLRTAH